MEHSYPPPTTEIINEDSVDNDARPSRSPPRISRCRMACLAASRGNVLFIVLAIVGLLVAQTVGALPLGGPSATPAGSSTQTIAYQGRLADASGSPLTGFYSMVFRLYGAPEGGSPLWEETWTTENSVSVNDGLFNIMLGSLSPISQQVITGNSSLYLGIAVGTDSEMTPRVQLGTVPYATQALTVPDNAVNGAKIADGAVATGELADAAVTAAKIQDGAITAAKLAPELMVGVPKGTIVMWSGS